MQTIIRLGFEDDVAGKKIRILNSWQMLQWRIFSLALNPAQLQNNIPQRALLRTDVLTDIFVPVVTLYVDNCKLWKLEQDVTKRSYLNHAADIGDSKDPSRLGEEYIIRRTQCEYSCQSCVGHGFCRRDS